MFPSLWPYNLVPRVLSYPPNGTRERETLENAGHVNQNKINSEGGVLCLTFFVWFIRNVHAVIVTARQIC